MDRARDSVLQNKNINNSKIVGTATEDFSVMEASILIAKIFKEITKDDIVLCLSNARISGNNWQIYKDYLPNAYDCLWIADYFCAFGR